MSEAEITSNYKDVSDDENSDSESDEEKPKGKKSLKKSKNDSTDDERSPERASTGRSKRETALKGKSKKEKDSKSISIDDEEKEKIPLLDQPAIIEGSRNRKTFVSFESKVTVTKHSPIEIPNGKGVQLGRIPLINSRLKRLRQNVLKELHRTIFGKCGNPANFLVNLQKFNGFPFVKDSDEYKRKLALFNKFHMVDIKELMFLLDLDMKVRKKEEAVKLVLDFLISPEATENTQNAQPFGHPKRKATKRNYHEADVDDVDVKKKKKAKANVKSSKEDEEEDEPVKKNRKAEAKSRAAKKDEITPDEDDSSKEEEPESDDNSELKKPAKKRKRNQVIEEQEESTEEGKSKKRKSTDEKSKDSNKKCSSGKKSISKNEKDSTSELTDDELRFFLKKVLADANLEETTMKTVYGLISTHYPNYNFSKKKDFIKSVVKSLIQS